VGLPQTSADGVSRPPTAQEKRWLHHHALALPRPEKFVVGVNVVGVSDLVERMGSKSESYRRTFAEQKGFGCYAYEKLKRYIERSPAHQAHRLQTPVLIHLASNDTDVRINETMHLIDALKAADRDFEYEIYQDPPGGTRSTASTPPRRPRAGKRSKRSRPGA
jgi:hypothetical protein